MNDLLERVNPQLKQYVEKHILPRYDFYDAAHSRAHILMVIEQSFEICEWLKHSASASKYDSMQIAKLNVDMLYVIAAYHDIGMCEGRELHNINSGKILTEDKELSKWFSPEQLVIMKEAVEDHRASSGTIPRSIYGKVLSEADKIIDPDLIISRIILYEADNCPELTPQEQYFRFVTHLKEKYGDGGYLHFQFENSPNVKKLEQFRKLIRDPEALKIEYDKFSLHPLKPFLPDNARVLFLGSFPPPKARWSMDFYYPNFQNDMWRILGLVFYEDRNYFVKSGGKGFDYDKVVAFCNKIGLAIYDAAYMIKREKGNAADKFLKIMIPADLKSVLSKIPQCNAIVATGGKSAEVAANVLGCNVPVTGNYREFCIDFSDNRLKSEINNVIGNIESKSNSCDVKDNTIRKIRFYRMPSSSRAYPMSIENKAEIYHKLFSNLRII